jgi:ABC-type Zn uptake system ZnuABC Zn-binding protein ZnuA
MKRIFQALADFFQSLAGERPQVVNITVSGSLIHESQIKEWAVRAVTDARRQGRAI